MNLIDRITVETGKMGGRPCIQGMRMRVTDALELLAGGARQDQILSDFPYLESDDIRAALVFAARELDHPVVITSAE